MEKMKRKSDAALSFTISKNEGEIYSA